MATGQRHTGDVRLREAYAACERLVRGHYENFPVASMLLPRAMRRHVAAVYAFARIADDFADEGTTPAEDRHRLLDEWLAHLRACVEGNSDLPTFIALGATIRECNLPVQLFEDLLSAFRQDITTDRYGTWAGLLDYCRRSANPVGRLVLRIAGRNDPALDRASDALCTALQLTNFWQDLERDWHKGRLYIPADDRDACGAAEADLAERRMTDAWRCALGRVVDRTHECFSAGRPALRWCGGPPPLRTAPDLAGWCAHPRANRALRVRRVHIEAGAGPCRRCRGC